MRTRSYQTDSKRNDILKAVITRFEETTNPVFQTLVPTFLEPAKQNLTRFDELTKEDERLEALISEKTDLLKKSYESLEGMLRRFWMFLIDRQKSTGGSTELLRQFGLSESGKRPKLKSRKNIADAARKVLAGEAVAISRGLPPMGPVRAEQIEALLTSIDAEEVARNGLKEAYDLNLASLNRHRVVVDRLILKLRTYLRAVLMDESENTKRQLQRRLGFDFLPTRSDVVEPDGPDDVGLVEPEPDVARPLPGDDGEVTG